MPNMLVKKVSVKASSSSRVSWCPVIMKFPKTLQLLLVYKNYGGKLSLQQMSGPTASVKVPFGQVAKCEYTKLAPNADGEVSEYYNFFNNEGQKVQFNVNILNFFTAGVNPANQELAKLRTEQKLLLISHYLSLMARSVSFGLHRPELNTELGFRKDGAGLNEESLIKAGGSLEEYEKFIKLALISSHDPPGKKKRKAEPGTSKTDEAGKDGSKSIKLDPGAKAGSKITDFFSKQQDKTKMTKMEVVDKNFEEELEDPLGVEQTFVKGLFGRADIDLDQLSISPKLGIGINNVKVSKLKQSMESRFDPTACVLMVCPEEEDGFDPVNLDRNYYQVIHGSHRLRALKRIDSEGGKI